MVPWWGAGGDVVVRGCQRTEVLQHDQQTADSVRQTYFSGVVEL